MVGIYHNLKKEVEKLAIAGLESFRKTLEIVVGLRKLSIKNARKTEGLKCKIAKIEP